MDHGPNDQADGDSDLTLVTLGQFALRRAGGEGLGEVFGPGKPLALITYLSAAPGARADRDQLVDLLWSHLDPRDGRHALRQAIWHIRHRLGDGSIAVERNGAVHLRCEVQSDRGAFLRAIHQQDFGCAVDLYHGEFLPGFAAPGGAEFEHWADVERARLCLLFLRAAETSVRHWLSQARFREAERLARRVRDTHPDRESGWRLLLEALLSGGDTVAAAGEAAALAQLLTAYDREPEPATRTLVRLAREGPVGDADPRTPAALVAELVGREREFAGVVAAWDVACRGRGQHVHLKGAPGVGKTRLLGDLRARLRVAGARVVQVPAHPGERTIEFAMAADLAAALAGLGGALGISPSSGATLVSLNPTLSARYRAAPDRASGADTLRRRAIALRELLAAVADEAPVAILLDDVHWSDSESRQILQMILDDLPDHSALVVTASRPVAETVPITAGTSTFELQPLTVSQIRALVGSIAALPAEPWAEALPAGLHSATAGSPLLVLETIQLAIERGILFRREEGWECLDPAALAADLAGGGALRQRLADLDRGPAWLLLLLSIAGAPVSGDLLSRAAQRPLDGLMGDLGAMEQRGLVRRVGQDWQPAHDEVADRSLDLAPEGARRAAHRSLGLAFLEAAGTDRESLFQSVRHLAQAEDNGELVGAFRRWVSSIRRQGDRRSLPRLAASVLDAQSDDLRRRDLIRALPIGVRLGLDTPARQAITVATVAVMGLSGAVALLRAPRPPDIYLVGTNDLGGDSSSVLVAPLHRARWDETDLLRPGAARGATITTLEASPSDGMAWSPDGRSLVTTRVVRDSGERELFLIDANGLATRITHSTGDDAQASWAPDGRSLVFQTVRWSPLHHYDLAVLDLPSGQTRALTRTDDSDHTPAWSQDGSRVAFRRQYWDRRPSAVCWITLDAATERCLPVPGYQFSVAGWRSDRETLLSGSSGRGSALLSVDAENGSMRVLDSASVAGRHWVVSPDGRWIACLCQRSHYPDVAWYVWPTEAPEQVKRVQYPGIAARALEVTWRPSSPNTRFLDSLQIVATTVDVPLDAVHQLHVAGLDQLGQRVATPVVSWASSDTGTATVDTAGAVYPRALGRVTIHASAGGWRQASLALTIIEPAWRPVLSERWTGGLDQEWVPFGVPRPVLTSGPGGVATFWHRGDSTWHSGAYSRRQFDARRGLGLETTASIPVNALQWQFLNVQLDASLPPDLGAWDHATGGLPLQLGGRPRSCKLTYPLGDGFENLDRFGTPEGPRQADSTLRTGRWFTIRLQVFPDGRCGVAVDGKPIAGGETLALDRPFRVVLHGKSVGTRVLVGPLEVWEGVRSDVDWGRTKRR